MTSEAELCRVAVCDAAVEAGILLSNSARKAAMPTADVERIDHFAQLLAATPPAQGEAVACQACGGRIEGWTCQVCARVFLENDAGALVMDTAPPPVTGEGVREAAADIVRRWADWIIWASSDMESADPAAGKRTVRAERNAILAALTPPAGGEG